MVNLSHCNMDTRSLLYLLRHCNRKSTSSASLLLFFMLIGLYAVVYVVCGLCFYIYYQFIIKSYKK